MGPRRHHFTQGHALCSGGIIAIRAGWCEAGDDPSAITTPCTTAVDGFAEGNDAKTVLEDTTSDEQTRRQANDALQEVLEAADEGALWSHFAKSFALAEMETNFSRVTVQGLLGSSHHEAEGTARPLPA
ncbi:hypothetical protein E2C01_022233 [Portunus trituberculatus]|uniref:Uncharacterized protein n=1 Tax=Portunus trituberculatus TaxID=210409 RepID=A0A5B7E6Q4_PORTR|nr:hypothetical protein [Portunus trituberculatus]